MKYKYFFILVLFVVDVFAYAENIPEPFQKDNLLSYIKSLKSEFTEYRHHLHSYPEVGYNEHQTSKYIIDRLKDFGYQDFQMKSSIGGTGIIVTLDTGKPGKVVALRADMDGLPITEDTDLDYASKNKNVMHACGHDGHMATMLMVAKTLIAHKDNLKGVLKFIFQPAEEGGKGAEKIIAAGALENPTVDAIYGLHAWPEKQSSISVRSGTQMAGATIFDITVKGKGGHAAMPHLTVNPIFITAKILNDFEGILQQKDPTEPMALNITYLESGTTYNVVPDDVKLKGTLRTVSRRSQEAVLTKMRSIISNTCNIYHCEGELQQQMEYPATINTAKETNIVLKNARELYPNDDSMVFVREYPVLPAEDFSLYLEKVPGSFFFLGQGDATEIPALHSNKFNFNDETMITGAYVLVRSTVETLYQN